MKKVQFTQEQQHKIKVIAKQIRCSKHAEFDNYAERGDFYYLYNDIIQELSRKDKNKMEIFYEFIKLDSELL